MKSILGKIVLRGSAVFLLGLGGCSHKPKPVVLRWATWGDVAGTQIRQTSLEVFKKDHPGVEVRSERTPYGDYVSKILTQYAAGLAPDVIELSSDLLVDFASRELLVDLRPFADKDTSLRLSDFFPEAIQHVTVQGALDALPCNVVPIAVIYYNKKEFDEAGLAYPQDDWNYLQFLQAAQKLTKKDAKGNTVQFGFVDDWPIWDAWVYDFGGELVDNPTKPTRCALDSPGAIAGVRFRADLIHKYGVMPGPAYVTAMGGTGNSDLFMNGIAAMYFCGIWQTPTFRLIKNFDWDTVEFPKGPQGRRGFPITAEGYAVLKTCPRPELAYELVRHLAGEEGQKYVTPTGLSMPALRPLAQSKIFLDGQKPLSKGFLVRCVKDGRFAPFDPRGAEWTNRVGSALDRVWNGTAAPEEVLKNATREVNERFFSKPDKK